MRCSRYLPNDKGNEGFTSIDLMIVGALIAIIAAVSLPSLRTMLA